MKKLTLSQAFDGFILDKQAASKSANTLRNYRVTFSKVALWLKTTRPDDQDPPFADLTRQDWIAFMAWLQHDCISAREGVARREPRMLSQKSLLNIHTDLCALYTWATTPGIELVSTHTFHTIERPEADAPVIETFTREQADKMLKAYKESRA